MFSVWIDNSGACAAASCADPELIFLCRARLEDRARLLQLLQIDTTRGATLADGQILRQCYKKWREDTPQHVYGDFAFVAWERWSQRTVAATDHRGNFPLFYCRTGGRIEVLAGGHLLVHHEEVVRIEKWWRCSRLQRRPRLGTRCVHSRAGSIDSHGT